MDRFDKGPLWDKNYSILHSKNQTRRELEFTSLQIVLNSLTSLAYNVSYFTFFFFSTNPFPDCFVF